MYRQPLTLCVTVLKIHSVLHMHRDSGRDGTTAETIKGSVYFKCCVLRTGTFTLLINERK